MKRIFRGLLALAVTFVVGSSISVPDAEAQWINNRTVANSQNFSSVLRRPNLPVSACPGACRARGCRTWVYVRGARTSNGIPYCLFFNQRKALVYNTCCLAGFGRGGGGVTPPVNRRLVVNYPRWRGRIVDHCRTWATNCGWGGANYYCRLRGFQRASSWRRYRPGSTYVIGSRRVCNGGGCVGFSQVVCVGRRTGGVVPPSGGGNRTVRINYPRWGGAIVDHCRTWASNCGWGGANYYCQRRGFRRATNWSRYRPGRTYVVGSNRYCNGGGCVGFRHVTCTR